MLGDGSDNRGCVGDISIGVASQWCRRVEQLVAKSGQDADAGRCHGHAATASARAVEDGPAEVETECFAWQSADDLDPAAGFVDWCGR